MEEREKKEWKPFPGPQSQALNCEADILLYGGAAGGGKTDLLLGLAKTNHHRSIIFRRQFSELQAIEDRANEIYLGLGNYNKSEKVWRFYDARQIEFGAVKDEKSIVKYQGRAHDLKCFDEVTNFTEKQFRFLGGWNRTSKLGQRTRIVCTSNPPTNTDGDWIINFWGAWLDKTHPNPALPGELRWYTNIDGKEVELLTGESFYHNDEKITPLSRTFIPAKVGDNPYYANGPYLATLQALPEPLRSKMLKGDFTAGREDDQWQVIPSEWVRLAQARWLARGKPRVGLSALGVDVARGGNDKTVLTPRYGNYFGSQRVYEGKSTPDGVSIVQHILLVPDISSTVDINVDVIGVGASVYDQLVIMGFDVHGLQSAGGSEATDLSGLFEFLNKRAEWWWSLRMALDPESGDELALPDDPELLADLCAPRWKISTGGKIQIEPKEDVIKRIGRSPDKGDSVVYAHAQVSDGISFTSARM